MRRAVRLPAFGHVFGPQYPSIPTINLHSLLRFSYVSFAFIAVNNVKPIGLKSDTCLSKPAGFQHL